ncbi:MAG: sugar transferase [Halobacteria archaeon]|nr:sugar transferase [Halobacteria archaeon]
MKASLRYRFLRGVGAVVATVVSVVLANHPLLQRTLTTYVPVVNRLNPVVLSNGDLTVTLMTTLVVVLGSLIPLFKPKPRRILDTVFLTHKRILVAGFALAAIGYFDYTYKLPRPTLILVVAVLSVTLPAWFVYVRRSPETAETAVLVGNDIETMRDIVEKDLQENLVGFVSPLSVYSQMTGSDVSVADGGAFLGKPESSGVEIEWLGSFTRLDDILVKTNADTAVLAFVDEDRSDFFGVLDTCYEHGVKAKAHRDHVDSVLMSRESEDELVDIELEPIDPQDYVFKRVFDIAFAGFGLLALSPLIGVIAAAIKLDSPGPVLYEQERTAEFGDTFSIYKFRSMLPESESPEPVDDTENHRITRVGRVIRKTHMDEIPQLWSILVGDMSVVGPRAVWRDEEVLLEKETEMWRKRWFIKPGLTGLAQINDASSTEPEKKLRYDLEYIRDQSFWLDIKIVVRQIWMVVVDALGFVVGEEDDESQG